MDSVILIALLMMIVSCGSKEEKSKSIAPNSSAKVENNENPNSDSQATNRGGNPESPDLVPEAQQQDISMAESCGIELNPENDLVKKNVLNTLKGVWLKDTYGYDVSAEESRAALKYGLMFSGEDNNLYDLVYKYSISSSLDLLPINVSYKNKLNIENLEVSQAYQMDDSRLARLFLFKDDGFCKIYGVIVSAGDFVDPTSGTMSFSSSKSSYSSGAPEYLTPARELLSKMLFADYNKDTKTKTVFDIDSDNYLSVN